jgi:hypothetical protein
VSDRYAVARREHVATVLDGSGHTTPALRHAAAEGGELPAELRALSEKVHRHAYKVTDEDIAALNARNSDNELFELIVSAALGASLARLERGLKALEEAAT